MEGYYVGRVSSADASRGYVKVTYPGEGDVVSDALPCLAFEYAMPAPGDLVATVLDKRGGGVCLGKIFSNTQTPDSVASSGYKRVFTGDFEVEFDNGYIRYSGGVLYVKADNIVLDGYEVPTGD